MPRVCTVCSHAERSTIDKALVAGEPFRNIAERFETSSTALFRHKADHIPPALAKAQEAATVREASSLLQEVRTLRSKAVAILMAAERTGDLRTALAGVREARGCLELLAEMEGQVDKRPIVNLTLSPEWIVVRSALLSALAPFREARIAVADRLAALEATNGHRG